MATSPSTINRIHNTKKHLQQGLDPASKAVRVFNFVRSMHKEVDALAHSCSVHKAQDLQRFHARMRTIDGKSASLEEVYPTPEPLQTIPS